MLEEFINCTSCECYTCSQNYSCSKAEYENPCLYCEGMPPYMPWDAEDEKLFEIECDIKKLLQK